MVNAVIKIAQTPDVLATLGSVYEPGSCPDPIVDARGVGNTDAFLARTLARIAVWCLPNRFVPHYGVLDLAGCECASRPPPNRGPGIIRYLGEAGAGLVAGDELVTFRDTDRAGLRQGRLGNYESSAARVRGIAGCDQSGVQYVRNRTRAASHSDPVRIRGVPAARARRYCRASCSSRCAVATAASRSGPAAIMP